MRDLADALIELKNGIVYCQICFNITGAGGRSVRFVPAQNAMGGWCAWWRSRWMCWPWNAVGVYQGHYHVLHGALSPIEGIGPEDLTDP